MKLRFVILGMHVSSCGLYIELILGDNQVSIGELTARRLGLLAHRRLLKALNLRSISSNDERLVRCSSVAVKAARLIKTLGQGVP